MLSTECLCNEIFRHVTFIFLYPSSGHPLCVCMCVYVCVCVCVFGVCVCVWCVCVCVFGVWVCVCVECFWVCVWVCVCVVCVCVGVCGACVCVYVVCVYVVCVCVWCGVCVCVCMCVWGGGFVSNCGWSRNNKNEAAYAQFVMMCHKTKQTGDKDFLYPPTLHFKTFKLRGLADKFCLHLNRKWTGKDILMK